MEFRLECVDGKFMLPATTCKGKNENEFFSGILIKSGSLIIHRISRPFKARRHGNSIIIGDDKKTIKVNVNETQFANIQDFMSFIEDCNCCGGAGGGSSLPDGNTAGQVLTWNGTEWVPDEVPNPLPNGTAAGQVLTWDGDEWLPDEVPDTLPDGNDVGEILIWDGTQWVPDEIPVTLPNGTAAGQIMFWNGTEWVLEKTNLVPDGTVAGQVLTWDGTNVKWTSSLKPQIIQVASDVTSSNNTPNPNPADKFATINLLAGEVYRITLMLEYVATTASNGFRVYITHSPPILAGNLQGVMVSIVNATDAGIVRNISTGFLSPTSTGSNGALAPARYHSSFIAKTTANTVIELFAGSENAAPESATLKAGGFIIIEKLT